MKQQKEDQSGVYELLATEYIRLLNDLDALRDRGLQLQALYLQRIGKYQVERLRKQLDIKALKRKIELVQALLVQEKPVALTDIELQVAVELAEAEAAILKEVSRVDAANYLLAHLATPEQSAELRKIYRQVAKQLHPDVNPTVTEEQTRIWHLVKTAYENCDLQKLKALLLVYKKEISAAAHRFQQHSADFIELGIEFLTDAIRSLQTEIFELHQTFPFNAEPFLKDEEWLKKEVAQLKKHLDELSAYESDLLSLYTELTLQI